METKLKSLYHLTQQTFKKSEDFWSETNWSLIVVHKIHTYTIFKAPTIFLKYIWIYQLILF